MRFILHLDDDICLVGLDLPADLLDEVVGCGAGGHCYPCGAFGAALVDQTYENSHGVWIIIDSYPLLLQVGPNV